MRAWAYRALLAAAAAEVDMTVSMERLKKVALAGGADPAEVERAAG